MAVLIRKEETTADELRIQEVGDATASPTEELREKLLEAEGKIKRLEAAVRYWKREAM